MLAIPPFPNHPIDYFYPLPQQKEVRSLTSNSGRPFLTRSIAHAAESPDAASCSVGVPPGENMVWSKAVLLVWNITQMQQDARAMHFHIEMHEGRCSETAQSG